MSLHTGCSAHTDWEQSVSPQECQTKSRADGLSRQTLTEEGVGKKGHHSLKKKKKMPGGFKGTLPCSSNGLQNLACVDQGKKIYVCDVCLKENCSNQTNNLPNGNRRTAGPETT